MAYQLVSCEIMNTNVITSKFSRVQIDFFDTIYSRGVTLNFQTRN